MLKSILISITGIISLIFFIQSCKSGSTCGTVNISSANSNSHHMGQNCMDCHVDKGQGKGCFIAAGTVYNKAGTATMANQVIKLHTAPNGGGQLAATIYGDSRGNFYTTETIAFGAGLYPSITNSNDSTIYMPTAITVGTCNGCHGVSAINLYVQ